MCIWVTYVMKMVAPSFPHLCIWARRQSHCRRTEEAPVLVNLKSLAVVFCLKLVFNLAMGFSFGDPHKRSPCCLPVQRTFRFMFSLFNKGSFRGEDDIQGTDRQPYIPSALLENKPEMWRTVLTFCTPHWTRCTCVCMSDLFTRVWMCGCMMYLYVHVCVYACVLENTSGLPGNPPLLRTSRKSSDQALSFSVTMPMTCELPITTAAFCPAASLRFFSVLVF